MSKEILLSISVDETHQMRSLRDSSTPVVYKETRCLNLKTDLKGRNDKHSSGQEPVARSCETVMQFLVP
jgi:hypothetical protein